ncbi:13597_t:CDS:1 [Cetraspora pellucida]|uniref:13597_t:CDS:1 n=1 Tax=Cetraspora pellucida TaxID=1433469 RepID=A0ACA9Q5Y6_9GLOM|nr:13597_t:CDS:1 [Cetraspora pellucida]
MGFEKIGKTNDEICKISQNLVRGKKLLGNFNSLKAHLEILQQMNYEHYQKIFHSYENFLYKIMKFVKELSSLQGPLSYFMKASRIKEEYMNLKKEYEIQEKELNSIMLKMYNDTRKDKKNQTEDFIKIDEVVLYSIISMHCFRQNLRGGTPKCQ